MDGQPENIMSPIYAVTSITIKLKYRFSILFTVLFTMGAQPVLDF